MAGEKSEQVYKLPDHKYDALDSLLTASLGYKAPGFYFLLLDIPEIVC